MKLLYGDEFLAKKKECELKGLVPVLQNVITLLRQGREQEILKVEADYIWEKIGEG